MLITPYQIIGDIQLIEAGTGNTTTFSASSISLHEPTHVADVFAPTSAVGQSIKARPAVPPSNRYSIQLTPAPETNFDTNITFTLVAATTKGDLWAVGQFDASGNFQISKLAKP